MADTPAPPSPDAPRRVALFVTCVVDFFRPTVGFAAVRLLERAGCQVEVPPTQVCCGQPAYNSGDRADAVAVAKDVVAAFEGFEHIVVPSGSCAAMIRVHYPKLLGDDPVWGPRAHRVASRTHELVSFLTDVCGFESVADVGAAGSVTYHDGCSGLREMGIKQQPRKLLASIPGLELKEMLDAEVCCGFGGTFCVKYPDISGEMARKKAATIAETGADTVLAGDVSCLLNIAGKLSRDGHTVKARHVAEVLAGMTDTPPIGAGSKE
ncbi:MAG: (Fe-S)-binding protein [Rhodospirillaceae bacterium]|nr:(Fe-S)-binding protein [Rhodospirillaceae bacterium]